MTEQIDNLLRKEYASLGSIDGTLEMVSLRNNRRFHISYNNTGKTVKCDLPTHLEQEVIKALGRQVTVFGVIYRNIDGLPLHVDVHTVTLLENTYTPIPLSELMGSLPNITDGLSTEDVPRYNQT